MKPSEVKELVNILMTPGSCSYHRDAKIRFHLLAMRYMKSVAKLMGLKTAQYDLRSNLGGAAVSGEVTLHTERVYFQLSNDHGNQLYRGCSGRKDYTGDHNQWFRPVIIRNINEVVETLLKITNPPSHRIHGD